MKKRKIEQLARVLCKRQHKNPDVLVLDGDAIQTEWEEDLYGLGKYDEIYIPDGTTSLGEEGHYRWREHIFDAKFILKEFGFSEID